MSADDDSRAQAAIAAALVRVRAMGSARIELFRGAQHVTSLPHPAVCSIGRDHEVRDDQDTQTWMVTPRTPPKPEMLRA